MRKELILKHLDLITENIFKIECNKYLASAPTEIVYAGYMWGVKKKLGELVRIWEPQLRTGSGRILIFRSKTQSLWYDLQSKETSSESGNKVDISKGIYTSSPSSCQSKVFVTMPNVIKELQDPSRYNFSARLEDAENTLKKSLANLNTEKSMNIKTKLKSKGDKLKLKVLQKNLYKPQKQQLGLVNSKNVDYRDQINALHSKIFVETGFQVKDRDAEKLSYEVLLDPFQENRLSYDDITEKVGRVYEIYRGGMDKIHSKEIEQDQK